MLFTDITFIFLFLPAVVGLFYWLGSRRRDWLWILLLGAAVLFYAVGAHRHLPLLAASVFLNFSIAGRIASAVSASATRRWLITGIVLNLAGLAYFKYSKMLASLISGTGFEALVIDDLPVGISFYTFTQIAYLVDLHRRQAPRYRLGEYATFVSYFPHLVAGPVLHHTDVLPQLRSPQLGIFSADSMFAGLVLFSIGLGKKVLLADNAAPIADGVFQGAEDGVALSFAEAWLGVLAYAMQIYFDFSGYSDMARGASRLLGIDLPINFDSPYRATSLIDFWRRWHITLSRFLRNYLYFPLGGNRRGLARTTLNLLITMTLGGLWHGAGMGFIVWGLLHGVALGANHWWRNWLSDKFRTPALVGWALTMLIVCVGWTFFRADTVEGAHSVLTAMAGFNGFDLPAGTSFLGDALPSEWIRSDGMFSNGVVPSAYLSTVLLALMFVIAVQPVNSNRIVERIDLLRSDMGGRNRLRTWCAFWAGALFAFAVASLGRQSPFLYYQF